jgi:hypothetical protein
MFSFYDYNQREPGLREAGGDIQQFSPGNFEEIHTSPSTFFLVPPIPKNSLTKDGNF